MKDIRLTVPELALIAGTRAAMGAGVGLLAADYLSHDQRRSVGWTLVRLWTHSARFPWHLKSWSDEALFSTHHVLRFSTNGGQPLPTVPSAEIRPHRTIPTCSDNSGELVQHN